MLKNLFGIFQISCFIGLDVFFSSHTLNHRRGLACRSSRGLGLVQLYDCILGLFLVVGQRYGHLDDFGVLVGPVKSDRMDR